MAYIDSGTRVGRSQAVSIFWGLVSVFFAAAACYYFWKYHENETSANVLRDQVLTLQEQGEALNSQKNQLQANMSDSETQLKSREDFLQEKETKLAQEESQLESLGQANESGSAQSRSQAVVVKKFNDAVRKLVKDADTDVVVRGGRPVLRVPSSVFFAFGDATLKPEGKAMLHQIAQTLDGQLDNFELRVETFTDSEGENASGVTTTEVSLGNGTVPPAKDGTSESTPDKTKTPDTAGKSPAWELTGKRAGVLARFIREQTSLPFQNVLVVPRADFQPIIPAGTEGHARNRRIEITITPLPATFHSVDASDKATATEKSGDHGKAKKASTKATNKALPLKDSTLAIPTAKKGTSSARP